MRGNWETAEALVLVPGQQIQHQQQQQQQQQSIMEEQRLPLHSPTTPAWSGITDRIVKEEPVEHHEDKNNDSGVSPGHYTSNSASPRSRRSSSTANCSLSPGSASSQDSNAMQCESFDYSPQSIYKNCPPSLDYARLHAMNDLSQHRENEHSAMDVVSNSMKPGCEESEVTQDTLQCPICSFTTLNRMQFTEHLAAHYAANCETPDFSKSLLTGQESESTNHQHHHHHQQQQQQQQQQQMQHSMVGMMGMDEASRASPSQGDRSEQESEEADEPGLRVPRVNSQGKVKKFRCKQCNFVAITKLEFWEHSRGHIKAEKLLTCPKCPFVTEYKHHLEYHLRNHFGSKPFKCDKCSYSCVNKSMLNSHLKSHSNVYQYRCANCAYATKYCHSLKLHLRKYSHQPAMVLNADGSPNPLPIIDVYGTRRGPKQKPSNAGSKVQEEMSGQMMNGGLQSPGHLQGQMPVGSSQLSPVSHHLPMNPMSAMHALTNGVNQGVMGFPYGQLFTGFPLANHYPIQDHEATEKQLEHLKTNLFVEYAKAMANERMNVDYPQDLGNNGFNGSNPNSARFQEATSPSSEVINDLSKSVSPPPMTLPEVVPTDGKITPLDLSKPEVVANNNNNNNNNNNSTNTNNNNMQDRTLSNGFGSNANSPKTTGTSRRKGRAVKLDRRVVEAESEDEDKDNEDYDASRVVNESNATNVESSKEASPDRNFGGVGMSNEFTCQYCEIAFGNVVMYTVHMGYHGYKDPYTCNMCGHECDDKVSFFLHIARSKHS